jgi:uncharacterized membrane protein
MAPTDVINGARTTDDAEGRSSVPPDHRLPRPGTTTARPMDQPRDPLARSLGWFSVALGTSQVLTPGLVIRAAGLRNTPGRRAVMRLIGVRELAAAAGILGPGDTEPFLWARVAGDAMDLTLLGLALRKRETGRLRVALATLSVLGVTVADTVAALRHPAPGHDERGGSRMHTQAAVTVNRDVDEVYRFWHDFENFPRFMTHVDSVERTGNTTSHWKATAPGGAVEWDAEMVADVPGERIQWRSRPGAQLENSGVVRFRPAPGNRGTELIVELDYQPPAGALGEVIAKVFGEESTMQVKDDLRRFKQVMETGQVVRSESTPEGERTGRLLRQRPAQPLP